MSGHETTTDRGLLLSGRDWTVVGTATALMVLNVALMLVFVATPLAVVNDYLFAVPILGVIVYGLAIAGGELLAERGVENGDAALAVVGVAILQVAFGTFGAGVLSFAPPDLRLPALVVSGVVVAVTTAAIGTYVYARSATFEHYSSWANYAFIGGIAAAIVGTFVPVVLLVAFVLFFAGFLFRLGWEMWRIRDGRVRSVSLQAIGLYIAVAGVFVHVLQIAVRMLADR